MVKSSKLNCSQIHTHTVNYSCSRNIIQSWFSNVIKVLSSSPVALLPRSRQSPCYAAGYSSRHVCPLTRRLETTFGDNMLTLNLSFLSLILLSKVTRAFRLGDLSKLRSRAFEVRASVVPNYWFSPSNAIIRRSCCASYMCHVKENRIWDLSKYLDI